MTLQCFINYLCTDFRRLGKSYRWAAGTIGVVVVLFFSLEGDLFLKGFGTGNVLSTYFSSTIMTGFLIAFSFCAFPFATVYPEEREHKYIRYCVIRGNLKSYVLSKTTVIYISSLATMILGSLLFLLLCRIRVPWMDWGEAAQYDVELNGCYGSVLKNGHVILYCMLYALNLGLIAGALSNMAALCSVILSNTVLTLIFPVLAFRILVSVSIDHYNIYAFYPYNKLFPNDGITFLFLTAISVGTSILSAVGCYWGLKKKI